ncbi:MAG: hypothetical protein JW934_20900 [Anaerolineae bacterium]|nr:hypothetical protein [Anaerolineae bacterium]
MKDKLLLGIWRYLVPIPRPIWQSQVGGGFDLGFMSEAHHRVRNFVVTELPRTGQPLSPEAIAGALNLPLDRVIDILDELERGMTFLFRSDGRSVTWAYPVTVEPTPHRVTFSTGEQVYAA